MADLVWSTKEDSLTADKTMKLPSKGLETAHQGKTEFLNELRLISRLYHQKIISFISYCDEGDGMILVYEYASNGFLDHHLQDRNKRHQLTWAHRIQYALIIAKTKWTTMYEEVRVIIWDRPVNTTHIRLCPEYIQPSPHRARESSPTLDGSSLAPMQPTQGNRITTPCEICSSPHDTQYCMEDPKQAFVEYASSCTDEARASQDARLSKFEADFKQQQSEMTNKIDTVLKAITDRIAGALPSDTVKDSKLNTSPVLSARSYPTIDP
nr:probable receptor-like protein kinase At5g59700 [Tanacetum cinerariifolium]